MVISKYYSELYISHGNLADSDPVKIAYYKVVNIRFITLYNGIITGSLSAKFLRARYIYWGYGLISKFNPDCNLKRYLITYYCVICCILCNQDIKLKMRRVRFQRPFLWNHVNICLNHQLSRRLHAWNLMNHLLSYWPLQNQSHALPARKMLVNHNLIINTSVRSIQILIRIFTGPSLYFIY